MKNIKDLAGQLHDFSKSFRKEICVCAEEMMTLDLPVITEELFVLFEQTGNRLKYEEVYFGRRKFLAVFGLKSYVEKREEGIVSEATRKKLAEVMVSICQEECWALPAHVRRRDNPDWRVTVDLFASETAQTLGDLADSFGEELGEELTEMVVENVERRVFKPYFDSPVPYEPWEHVDTNWNAVCAGSIGSACIHLLQQQPERLDKCLDRICSALVHYVSGFSQDGVCMEGSGYYTYGMTYFVNFDKELSEYTEGEKSLLTGDWAGFRKGNQETAEKENGQADSGWVRDKRVRIAAFQSKCYFKDGRTVSFSDGSSQDKFRVGLTCVLAMRFPEVTLPDMSCGAGLLEDSCYRFAALKMDLTEPVRYISILNRQIWEEGTESESVKANSEIDCNIKESKNIKEGTDFYVFPYAEWCIGRSENGVGMACKGGLNGEPHNHNDVGHFIYEAGGEIFYTDLGAGEYTREYFSHARYEIFCNQSMGHSVPILCGQGQGNGRNYRCGRFQAKETGLIEMEIAGAYDQELVGGLCRRIQFDLRSGDMAVRDEFVPGRKQPFTVCENLITQIAPVVEENKVILNGEKGTCIMTIQGEKVYEILVKEFTHSNHSGIAEKVYAVQWIVEEEFINFLLTYSSKR